MLISDYHLTFEKETRITKKYLEYLIFSDQNKSHLLDILFIIYKDYMNKYDTPAIARISEEMENALKIYNIHMNTPAAKSKMDILELLHYINAMTILEVIDQLKKKPIKIGYDPAWVDKGPGFKVEKVNLDWKKGARAEVTWNGYEFEMTPRFRNSRMPQMRTDFTRNYYGNSKLPKDNRKNNSGNDRFEFIKGLLPQ